MRKFLLLTAATACGVGTSARADCVRHIYNLSEMTWSVSVSSLNGGIWLTNDAGCASPQGSGTWNLPPGCTVSISYAQNFVLPIGVIGRLYFVGSVTASYPYYQGVFESCGRLNHSGDTAAMNLNEPVDGDVQLFGQNIRSRAGTPRTRARTAPR
jgi:hypothetical protein